MFNNLKKKISDVEDLVLDLNEDLADTCEHEINKVRSSQGQVNKEIKDRLSALEDNQSLLADISCRSIDNSLKLDYIDKKLDKWRENHRENFMLLMEYLGLYFDYENDKKVIKKEKTKKK